MKKPFFLLACSILALTASAQSGISEFIYCEIVGTPKFLSNKITIQIDFGQATTFFESRKLRGKDGKSIVFNSMVDAMNWMGADDWEFVQAYVAPTVSNGTSALNVYHWLLKKNVEDFSREERDELLAKFKTTKP
ncbi:MAG: hypothetical protein LBU80_05510 [Rikenellaceae bacterium]|jgi:hypothetical protein|nr:hypothetical protein [Rikenellaceae bacterium]